MKFIFSKKLFKNEKKENIYNIDLIKNKLSYRIKMEVPKKKIGFILILILIKYQFKFLKNNTLICSNLPSKNNLKALILFPIFLT
jgi:hypothetical protein